MAVVNDGGKSHSWDFSLRKPLSPLCLSHKQSISSPLFDDHDARPDHGRGLRHASRLRGEINKRATGQTGSPAAARIILDRARCTCCGAPGKVAIVQPRRVCLKRPRRSTAFGDRPFRPPLPPLPPSTLAAPPSSRASPSSPSSFFSMQLHRRCRSRRCLIAVNNRCAPDTAAAALRLALSTLAEVAEAARRHLCGFDRSARLADPSRFPRFPSSLRAPPPSPL